jgi:hypothetical protein
MTFKSRNKRKEKGIHLDLPGMHRKYVASLNRIIIQGCIYAHIYIV